MNKIPWIFFFGTFELFLPPLSADEQTHRLCCCSADDVVADGVDVGDVVVVGGGVDDGEDWPVGGHRD